MFKNGYEVHNNNNMDNIYYSKYEGVTPQRIRDESLNVIASDAMKDR